MTHTQKRQPRRFYFSVATLLFFTACIAGFLAGFRVGYERGHQARTDQLPVSRIFYVADLIGEQLTTDDLTEVIETQVSPESWTSVGGIGHIKIAGDSLAIYQHNEVHDGIEALLEQMRQSRHKAN